MTLSHISTEEKKAFELPILETTGDRHSSGNTAYFEAAENREELTSEMRNLQLTEGMHLTINYLFQELEDRTKKNEQLPISIYDETNSPGVILEPKISPEGYTVVIVTEDGPFLISSLQMETIANSKYYYNTYANLDQIFGVAQVLIKDPAYREYGKTFGSADRKYQARMITMQEVKKYIDDLATSYKTTDELRKIRELGNIMKKKD